jgi:hypothetical protein
VKKDEASEKFNALMDKVERYAKLHELPRKLEDSIKLFYTFQHRKKINEVGHCLPPSIILSQHDQVVFMWYGCRFIVPQHEELLTSIPGSMRGKILAHRYKYVAQLQNFVCPRRLCHPMMAGDVCA